MKLARATIRFQPKLLLALLSAFVLAGSAPVWLPQVRRNDESLYLMHLLPKTAEGRLPFCSDGNGSSEAQGAASSRVRSALSVAREALIQGDCSRGLESLAAVEGAEAHRLQAELCLTQRQYECTRRALMLTETPSTAAKWLGDVATEQMQHGDPTSAVGIFRLAETFAPISTSALREYAASLTELGLKDQGIEVLREAIKRDPSDAESHYGLAAALWAANPSSREARIEAETAVGLRDYWPYHFLLGNIYRQLGRLSDAEEQFR